MIITSFIGDVTKTFQNAPVLSVDIEIEGKRLFYRPIRQGLISKIDHVIQDIILSSESTVSSVLPLYVCGTVFEPKRKNREPKKIEMTVVSVHPRQSYLSVAGIKHQAKCSFQQAWKRARVSTAEKRNIDVSHALHNQKHYSVIRTKPATLAISPAFSPFWLHQFAYIYDGVSVQTIVCSNQSQVKYQKKKRRARKPKMYLIIKNRQMSRLFINDNNQNSKKPLKKLTMTKIRMN